MPRSLTLPAAASAQLHEVGTGSYRRVERAALVIGVFELAFFAVAWLAHPSLSVMAKHAADLPLGNPEFVYLAAAIIGATFNPWMIFYQQSATVDKGLQPADLGHARWDTGVGAVLTQLLTGAVLIAAAAALGSGNETSNLSSVGQISGALTPLLGAAAGRVVFSMCVLGASLVAAIVFSLAWAWGVGEVSGYRRSLEYRPFEARWFYGMYALTVVGAAMLVWFVPNLVWLTIAAQVLNVFLMPLVIGLLVALAAVILPEPCRLRGWYMWLIIGISSVASAFGLFGGFSGLL